MRALERMLAAGVPLADALDIAREFESSVPDMIGSTARELAASGSDAKKRKRAADRDRIAERRKAAKVAEEVAEVSHECRATTPVNVAATNATCATKRDMSPREPTCERVVLPSLPSLPLEASEELNPLMNLSGSSPAKPKREKRSSRRCPESWEPNAGHEALAKELGFSPTEASSILASFRDHEFKTPKTDWDAAFRNWLRSPLNTPAASKELAKKTRWLSFAEQTDESLKKSREDAIRIAQEEQASGRRF